MDPVNPTNPIEIALRVLFMVLVVILAGTSQDFGASGGSGGGPPQDQPYRVLLDVDAVQVIVLESYPMQLVLNVSGMWRDGCRNQVFTEQRRDGNTVTVHIYQMHNPMMMCPTVIEPYQQSVSLEGGFENGHYVIQVNDYVTELDL